MESCEDGLTAGDGGFFSEAMSCRSDNKLQIEAVSSPFPLCVCPHIHACTYELFVEHLRVLLRDTKVTKEEKETI